MTARQSAGYLVALAVTGCGMLGSTLPGSLPPPTGASTATERITAKTAYVLLRSKVDLGDGRILNVTSDDAPRGFATSWHIGICSVQYNELITYEVSATGVVGKPKEEPYNPVFDDRAPPFTEATWKADSTDAARTLSTLDSVRSFYLEADDGGVLRWEIRDAQGERSYVEAGVTPVDTPPPNTRMPRVRR